MYFHQYWGLGNTYVIFFFVHVFKKNCEKTLGFGFSKYIYIHFPKEKVIWCYQYGEATKLWLPRILSVRSRSITPISIQIQRIMHYDRNHWELARFYSQYAQRLLLHILGMHSSSFLAYRICTLATAVHAEYARKPLLSLPVAGWRRFGAYWVCAEAFFVHTRYEQTFFNSPNIGRIIKLFIK